MNYNYQTILYSFNQNVFSRLFIIKLTLSLPIETNNLGSARVYRYYRKYSFRLAG